MLLLYVQPLFNWVTSLFGEEQEEKRKLDEEEENKIEEGGDGLSESLKPFHLSLEHIICTIFHYSTCTTLW